MTTRHTKQPAEVLPYDFDFGPWLENEGEALQASTATSTVTADTGISVAGTKTHDVATGVVQQWVSGGTAGQRYKITCVITLASGKVKELELVIVVQDN
jgi:hypothetical protein